MIDNVDDVICIILFCLGKKCATICPRIYRPVCGSDGSTYSNACMMEVAACITNEDISVEHEGECGMLKCIACLTCMQPPYNLHLLIKCNHSTGYRKTSLLLNSVKYYTACITNSSEASPTIWSCYENLNHYHYSFL